MLIRSILIVVAAAAAVCGQEKDLAPPYSAPPRLEKQFDDRFTAKIRKEYQIENGKGAVAWKKDGLRLSDGAIVKRRLDAESWTRLEIEIDLPELKKDKTTSEFDLWLELDGGNDMHFKFHKRLLNGKVQSSMRILTLKGRRTDKNPKRRAVASLLSTPREISKGKWQLSYRNGLCTVNGPALDKPLQGYFDELESRIDSLVLESKGPDVRVISLYCESASRVPFVATPALKAKRDLIRTRSTQVLKLYEARDSAKAIPLLKKTVSDLDTFFGPYHPSLSAQLENLGILYIATGDNKQAKKALTRANNQAKSVFGESHPKYAVTLQNLSRIHQANGEFEKAEKLVLQGTEILENLLGRRQLVYIKSRRRLADLYLAMKNFKEAERVYQQVIYMTRQIYGKGSPPHADSMTDLAELNRVMGNAERAEILFQTAKRDLERHLGQEHPWVAKVLDGLANLRKADGEEKQAKKFEKQAAEIRKKAVKSALKM